MGLDPKARTGTGSFGEAEVELVDSNACND